MSQISFSSAGDKEAVPGSELQRKKKKKLTVASPVNLPWQVDFSPYVPGILMRVTASVPNSEGQKRILLLHKK